MTQTGTPLRSWNLRRRILTIVGLQILGALILVGAGILYFTYQTEQTAWRGRQFEASQNSATYVAAFVQRAQDHLYTIANLEPEYLTAHPETLDGVIDQVPAFLEIVSLDQNGQLIVSAHQDVPVLSNLFTVVQSTWFHEATSGRSYLGNVITAEQNRPYLVIAVPRSDGGVVAARLDMTVLRDVVANIRFGESGTAYVVNQEGRFLAHTDPEVILDNQSIRRRPEMQSALSAPNYQWSGIYTNFQGQRVVGTTAPIANTDWIILTELPLTEAYATTRTAAIYTLAGFMLLALGTMFFLIRFLERLIFSPIADLQAGAEAIGRGDLSTRVPVAHRDEIGAVAESFNQMALSLDERNQELQARTNELAVARDQALEASRMKSQFLANMSHELRTPLNAILNFAEFVATGVFGEINDQQLGALQKVIGSGEHLLSLINDILDLTKIESGMMELFIEDVDLNTILSAVVNTGKSLAKDKPVEIIEDIDSDLPRLTGDRRRIQQIMLNLVSNAVKFTAEGSITITAHHDENTVELSVSDTGAGIALEDRSVIFESFRQGKAGARQGSGTGLGLPISKHLAEAHGGRLWVESEVGMGTTFHVTLLIEVPVAPELVGMGV